MGMIAYFSLPAPTTTILLLSSDHAISLIAPLKDWYSYFSICSACVVSQILSFPETSWKKKKKKWWTIKRQGHVVKLYTCALYLMCASVLLLTTEMNGQKERMCGCKWQHWWCCIYYDDWNNTCLTITVPKPGGYQARAYSNLLSIK